MAQNASSFLGAFDPDLIVEVTTACDRSCPGCYSPTLVSRASPEVLLASYPDLFMTPATLGDCLRNLERTDLVLSMRGGEPSRHPLLADLVRAARPFCGAIYVETHGRWLLREEPRAAEWLHTFRTEEVICKLSYDSMHGLRPEQLRQLTARLDEHGVAWQIAITEVTREEYEAVRASCPWIPDRQIQFQEKVANHNQLIHPPLGILSVDGRPQRAPSARASFKLVAP